MTLFLFDIDDTLLKSKDKILVKKSGLVHKRLGTEDFAHYKPEDDDEFDFSEFDDINNIQDLPNADKAFGLAILKQVYETHDENDIAVGLLTARARENEIAKALNILLVNEGLPPVERDLVFAINDPTHAKLGKSIPEKKLKIIATLVSEFDEVYFIDDDERNLSIVDSWVERNHLENKVFTISPNI